MVLQAKAAISGLERWGGEGADVEAAAGGEGGSGERGKKERGSEGIARSHTIFHLKVTFSENKKLRMYERH